VGLPILKKNRGNFVKQQITKHRSHGFQRQKKEGEAARLPGKSPNFAFCNNQPIDTTQKPKLKVGKARAKPDNFTDTSFRSKGMQSTSS
jgi:hypothetical protein